MAIKINKNIILIVLLSFYTIASFSQTVRVIDNKGTLKNVDANETNELQDLALNTTTNILTISGIAQPTQINLTPYLDNTDNQQITTFTFNETSNILTLTIENGGTKTVNLSSLIGDGNITSDDLTVGGDANALLADVTLEIAAGKVGTSELANDAVTTAKILDANVTNDKLATDAVESDNIKDGEVNTADIADENVTTVKLADDAVTNAKLADKAVNTENITDGTIATADVADDAINATKINADVAGTGLTQNATTGALDVNVAALTGDGNITSDDLTVGGDANALLAYVTLEIAAGKVGTTELANDAVITAKILDANVTTAKLADDAVTSIKILDANVTTTKIANDAVTNAKLADNAVNTENITDGTIATADVADDAINATKINADVAGTGLTQNATTGALDVNVAALTGDGNITSDDLTVGGDNNALLADVTLEIAAGKVGTSELANDAVTTAKILDANVTTAKLADDAVTSIKILDANVTTTKIANDAVTNDKLADNAVNTENITDGTIATADVANDAINATKINADVAGAGLTQNATTGALDVNVAALTGDGNITSDDLTVGGDANALLADVTLEIAAGKVGTAELANDAVTNAKIANDAVTNTKLADDAVNTENITDGTILLEDLGQNGAADGETIVWNDTNSEWSTGEIFIPKIAERFDTAGGQAITYAAGNFQTTANLGVEIQFGTSAVLDTDEYSSSSTSITVKKAGVYKVTYRVTAESGGSSNSRSGSEFKLTKTTGGSETIVPGSYTAAYHRNSGTSVGTTTMTRFVTLAANDVIKVRGNKYIPTTNNNHSIETSANGSSFTIEKIR